MGTKNNVDSVQEITFENVKKTYIQLLDDSNKLISQYTLLIEEIYSINLPSSTSFHVLLFTKSSFKGSENKLQKLKSKILDYEHEVNNWNDKAQLIYFETSYPPKLDNPNMFINYLRQLNFLLYRMNQMVSDVKILYSSINLKIDEIQTQKEKVISNRRFYIALFVAFIGIILSL